jgi:hypothetical protein
VHSSTFAASPVAIDPIAARTLRENIQSILRGLLGSEVVFLDNNVDAAVLSAVEAD